MRSNYRLELLALTFIVAVNLAARFIHTNDWVVSLCLVNMGVAALGSCMVFFRQYRKIEDAHEKPAQEFLRAVSGSTLLANLGVMSGILLPRLMSHSVR
jgi:hypothetical protein